MENSEWYALHVRPRFERVVAVHLKKQNIEYCLPLRRLSRKSSIRSIELPLLPGYVFCCVQIGESRSLWTIPGVLNVLGPAVETAILKKQVRGLKRIKDFEDLLDRLN
jgi:transcription antitermination factor NusG